MYRVFSILALMLVLPPVFAEEVKTYGTRNEHPETDRPAVEQREGTTVYQTDLGREETKLDQERVELPVYIELNINR